ncbi:hypothetical protein MKW92_019032 [Papaver armeniacum]|nr:hypothetical protein MKW92_019032 [Papaver armeniacum]
MKEEEVKMCQIQEWYPKFKSVSIKTQILELPESFVEYLLDDSGPFLLPESDSDDESEQPSPPPCFPELELSVEQSIETLDGAVFPKLNWSAPKDAAWINTTGNLKCTCFSEIALLLKSSESLTHDLSHAFGSCDDTTSSRPSTFYLALRKWYPSFHPDMEFRCFVSRGVLVGISQRDVTSFYPVLLEKKEDLKNSIQKFFAENKIKIIDFKSWAPFTLPLLFDWEELEMSFVEKIDSVPFRIVDTRCGVRPGLKSGLLFHPFLNF